MPLNAADVESCDKCGATCAEDCICAACPRCPGSWIPNDYLDLHVCESCEWKVVAEHRAVSPEVAEVLRAGLAFRLLQYHLPWKGSSIGPMPEPGEPVIAFSPASILPTHVTLQMARENRVMRFSMLGPWHDAPFLHAPDWFMGIGGWWLSRFKDGVERRVHWDVQEKTYFGTVRDMECCRSKNVWLVIDELDAWKER